MSKRISTRDALLALRQFQEDDAESKALITDLTVQLMDALDVRAARLLDALTTLEDYLDLQAEVHGFSEISLGEPKEEPKSSIKRAAKKKPAPKKTASKKKPSKKGKKVTKKRSTAAPVATEWPGSIDETIHLSDNERKLFELMRAKWPVFMTPDEMVQTGVCANYNAGSAIVFRLRKKGVPVESARQAQDRDPSVTEDTSGYRLIG